MQSLHYYEVKHRAIELSRGGFEGKTYDVWHICGSAGLEKCSR
jgi:hypothetical protein